MIHDNFCILIFWDLKEVVKKGKIRLSRNLPDIRYSLVFSILGYLMEFLDSLINRDA